MSTSMVDAVTRMTRQRQDIVRLNSDLGEIKSELVQLRIAVMLSLQRHDEAVLRNPTPPPTNVVVIRKLSFRANISSFLSALLSDALLFSLLIPVGGTYLESLLEQAFPVSAFVGTLLVVAGVVGLFHLAFFCNFDHKFWKELFFDTGYDSILWWRDLLNILTLLMSLWLMMDAVISPVGLKESNLGEGVVSALLQYWSNLGLPVSFSVLKSQTETIIEPAAQESASKGYLSWIWGSPSTPTDPTAAQPHPSEEERIAMEKIVNSGKFLLAVAWTTAFIMKMVYFTTLHTYARAMQIFSNMQNKACDKKVREGQSEQTTSSHLSSFSVYQKISKVFQAKLAERLASQCNAK